jgi:hypothetical protein
VKFLPQDRPIVHPGDVALLQQLCTCFDITGADPGLTAVIAAHREQYAEEMLQIFGQYVRGCKVTAISASKTVEASLDFVVDGFRELLQEIANQGKEPK